MDKEMSRRLKGIAIMMMLFLHLFNQMEEVALCTTFVNFWNGKPLVYALSRVGGLCVPIYTFLSGYGLYYTFDIHRGKLERWSRLRNLYVNYWVVLLLFVPVGAILAPNLYPGNAATLLLNIIAWEHSYNYEWWFFFPYVVLVLSAPYVFALLRRCGAHSTAWLMFGLTVVYFLTYAADKWRGDVFDGCYTLSQLRQLSYCFYSFMWGAVFRRFAVVARFRRCFGGTCLPWRRRTLLYGSLVALLLLRMSLGPSIVNPFFALPLILILCVLPPV